MDRVERVSDETTPAEVSPSPQRPNRPERPKQPLSRVGAWLAIIGAVLAVLGGVTIALLSSPDALATARAEVPEPAEFVSNGGTYRVTLLTGQGDHAAAALDCSAYLAGGETVVVGSTGGGSNGAHFDAPAGITTVTCDFADGRDPQGAIYGVSPSSTPIAGIGIAALVVGLLALGVGAVLLVVGRTRTGPN